MSASHAHITSMMMTPVRTEDPVLLSSLPSHNGDEGRCLESADVLNLDPLDAPIGQLDLRPDAIRAAHAHRVPDFDLSPDPNASGVCIDWAQRRAGCR
jgi:hypothetical protein